MKQIMNVLSASEASSYLRKGKGSFLYTGHTNSACKGEEDRALTAGSMEGKSSTNWGKSLAVPSVQEIVRKDAKDVPERYIQNEEDRPLASKISQLSSEIPIINLSLLDNGDEDELRKLDFASKEWGFFQVIDHGVRNEVLQNMEAAVASFFELPVEEKEKYAMAENDIQGYGQTYIVSDQQKLDWNDSMFLVTLPPKYQDMKYWPSTLAGFKEGVEQYAKEIEMVSTKILANLSVLMGMEKHSLRQMHGEMKQGIRLNYYSPCPKPDLVLGVSPHSDISSISLLVQEDEITGLQIRHKQAWVPVNPIPNAIVVNIGDVMEGWSNGVYKSIEHRAVTNQTKARISIAAFVIPEDEVDVGPVETMVDDCLLSRKYKSVKYIDFIRYNLGRKMDGKSHTDYLKL